MYNNEKRITKITVENRDDKWTWETPYNDTNMNDMLQAFYSICIGMTYSPSTVLRSMYEYALENLPYVDPNWDRDVDGNLIEKNKEDDI